jgi:hypothetical protein
MTILKTSAKKMESSGSEKVQSRVVNDLTAMLAPYEIKAPNATPNAPPRSVSNMASRRN